MQRLPHFGWSMWVTQQGPGRPNAQQLLQNPAVTYC
jgi:hypothetical protein